MPIWGNKASEKQSALSADFGHALTREILSTELLRVKAILATITLLVTTFIVTYAISPDTIERIWHGRAPVLQLAVTLFCRSSCSNCRCCGWSVRGWRRAGTCPTRAAISAP